MSIDTSKVTTEVDTSTSYKVRIFKNATPADIIRAVGDLPPNAPLEIVYVTKYDGSGFHGSPDSHIMLTTKVTEGFSR